MAHIFQPLIISSSPAGYSIGTEANLIVQPSQNFIKHICIEFCHQDEPQPGAFVKLGDGLLHVVDNGDVVVGDVEGDGPRGEEDEGLHQSLCLQEQPAPLFLKVSGI